MTHAEHDTTDGELTRVIIVEFQPNVTAGERAQFKGWLEELAAGTPGLLSMTCGQHIDARNEAVLNANAPEAAFGSFMSVWQFASGRALDDFLTQPAHLAMAATRFRRLVRRRYIANIRAAR